MKSRIHAFLLRSLVFALLWWALADGRSDSWLLGMVSVLAASIASLKLFPPDGTGISPIGALRFMLFFLGQSMLGGVQVAAQAFSRRMDFRPTLLELPISLPPGPARVWLVNTLNLLPGTVSVAIDGDRLRLHVLDARQDIMLEVRAAELRIGRMLGVAA